MKSFKGAFLINIFPIANSALKNLHRQTKNLVYNTMNHPAASSGVSPGGIILFAASGGEFNPKRLNLCQFILLMSRHYFSLLLSNNRKYSFNSFRMASPSFNLPANCLNRLAPSNPFVYQRRCLRNLLSANLSPKNWVSISQ